MAGCGSLKLQPFLCIIFDIESLISVKNVLIEDIIIGKGKNLSLIFSDNGLTLL